MAKKIPQYQFTARTADKHFLYEQAVQAPEVEVAFVDRVYRRQYGRYPRLFREDFCGTALVACEWAVRRPDNVAYAVDLDRETLEWGREHNVNMLPEGVDRRVHLIHDNVLNVRRPKVEVIAACNFSYYLFRELDALVAYFRTARLSLKSEGMIVLDAYGGFESEQVMQEPRKCDGFTYVWDQADYNPVNDHCVAHIHFRFPDKTEMKRAFSYHWRLWTLGGIRDALRIAGFRSSHVYWENENRKTGIGNGTYRPVSKVENTAGWVAYLVALP